MAEKQSNVDVLINQWQTCVEMADSVSQRRDTMNNIFATLNLAIIAAASFVWNIKTIALLAAGIIVCALWLLFIRNYKILNSAKFAVICEIESLFPSQPFNKEWEYLKSNKKYIEGTTLEKFLPYVFMLIYFVIAVILIINNMGGAAQ